MKRFASFVLPALCLISGMAAAQDAAPPRPGGVPPRGEGGFRQGGPSGDRGGDRRGGFWPGFGRPPMKSEEYDRLPEEDKKRIREAMDRVWGRPEVIEARERTMKAHADLRDTIRASLEKSDPEVAALLKKIEPEDGYDPRQLPPMPPVDSEEFPKAVAMRLGLEIMMFSRPERKEATRQFHEKIMASPAMQSALQALQSSKGEARIQAAQDLRRTYRESAMQEFQKLRSAKGAGETGKPPAPKAE